MRINTNVASLQAQEANKNVNNNLAGSLEKLGSGLRINKAADDASGLAIADKLRTQASSIGQGLDNAASASALIQIADKAMAEQSTILDTVKTKLIQAATDTTSADGKEAIRKDINKLLTQFDNIAAQTNYNGLTLLQASSTDTAAAAQLDFQLGEDKTFDAQLAVNYASNTAGMGGGADSLGDGQNYRGAAGDKVSALDANGTITVTTTATTDEFTLSGLVDNFIATDTMVVIANDAATIALLDAAVTASNNSIVKAGNNQYTIQDGLEVDFGTTNVSLSMTGAAAGNAVEINSTNAINIELNNLSAANAITVAGTGAGNLSGGNLLSALKGLTTNGLTEALANNYMTTVDQALTQLNDLRSSFGSAQNQIESSIRNMQTTQTNLQAAESVIRDVDYAAESANFNKQNIIAQAGTYAMSQANAVSQNVLRLLQ